MPPWNISLKIPPYKLPAESLVCPVILPPMRRLYVASGGIGIVILPRERNGLYWLIQAVPPILGDTNRR